MHFQHFWKSKRTLWSRRGQIQPSRVRFKSGFVSYQVDKPSPGGPTSTWWKCFLPGQTQNPAWIWASRTGFALSCFEVWRPGKPKTSFLGSKKKSKCIAASQSIIYRNELDYEMVRSVRSVRFKDGGSHDPVDKQVDVRRLISVCTVKLGCQYVVRSLISVGMAISLPVTFSLCGGRMSILCISYLKQQHTRVRTYLHPPPTFDGGHGSCLEHVWASSHFAIGLKPDQTSPYTSVNICLMTLIAETALEPDVAGL